ncbi:ATP-dependent RNA helicase glh-1 [Bienertia sinuspersici]
MPGKCLNCGESGHFKNKCPQPPKPKETTTSTQIWARGRKKGSKNRVRRTTTYSVNQEVPTPAELVKRIRKSSKEPAPQPSSSRRQPWLEATSVRGRGRGRVRGRNKGRGGKTPVGVGLLFDDDGSVLFRGSTSTPPVVLSQGEIPSQPSSSQQL